MREHNFTTSKVSKTTLFLGDLIDLRFKYQNEIHTAFS